MKIDNKDGNENENENAWLDMTVNMSKSNQFVSNHNI